MQAPRETLALGGGSCRDYAVLMMEAARHWGFGAQFVTGYIQMEEGQHGARMPGRKSISGGGLAGLDPANNKLAGNEHISSRRGARAFAEGFPLSGYWSGLEGRLRADGSFRAGCASSNHETRL